MNLRLGKRPARKGAIALAFESYFDASQFPALPAVFGKTSLINEWGMLGNNSCGDCVLAGAAHETMLWTAEGERPPVKFTKHNVLSDYSALTGYNANDPASDQGSDMQAAAAYRQKIGVLDASGVRHQIGPYVALRAGSVDEVLMATYLLGAVGVGIRFPANAETQFAHAEPWDDVSIGGNDIVGGHYIPCLHGETAISLLDGRDIPIRELAALGQDQWVYALNENHQVVPALATNIRQTGSGKSLVRIVLDDGAFFSCTADHLIMRRDGTYARADVLKSDDSLMPLYRKLSDGAYHKMRGYEEILDPHTEEWTFTHWRVTETEIGQRWGVIHHVDRDKRNNRPDNLERMSWKTHRAIHAVDHDALTSYAQSVDGRRKSKQLMDKSWADETRRARHTVHLKTNKKLLEHRKSGKWSNAAARSRNGKKTGPINIVFARTPKAIEKRTVTQRDRLKNDPAFLESKRSIARSNGSKFARLTEDQVEFVVKKLSAAPKGTSAALATRFGVARSLISRIKNGLYVNHKVAAVELVPGLHDVYDMEVPNYHNFAVGAGVFVHNCVGRNSHGNLLCVTWGRLHAMTPRFLARYMDEGVAYFSPEMLRDDGLSRRGIDGARLMADMDKIRGIAT